MPQTELTAFQQNLSELIRARHPVLLVETQEPERVLDAVRVVNESGALPRQRQVKLFTLTNGLHTPGGEPVDPADVSSWRGGRTIEF